MLLFSSSNDSVYPSKNTDCLSDQYFPGEVDAQVISQSMQIPGTKIQYVGVAMSDVCNPGRAGNGGFTITARASVFQHAAHSTKVQACNCHSAQGNKCKDSIISHGVLTFGAHPIRLADDESATVTVLTMP